MGRPSVVVLVLLSLLAAGNIAFGSEVGNIHFGQLFVHPSIGVEATYDDNIFLLGDRKVNDFLFKIRPGIELDFSREGKGAHLNYMAEIGRYDDSSAYDYENHFLDGGVDLQFVNGLMFFVGDVFQKTNDRPTYEWVPLVQRTQNMTDVKVGYEFSDRWSFRGAYDHLLLEYDDAIYQVYDRDEDWATGTVFYRMFPKISVLGEVRYRWISYDQQGGTRYDSDGISAFLGLTGQITPKMVALFKAGYEQRDYDGPREDWDGAVFALDLVHHFSETLTLTVGGTRDAVESTYSTNNYFTSTEGRVGLEKQVGPKVSVGASGFYANSNYPEATVEDGQLAERDDDIWGARVEVKYKIQPWLLTSVWYSYQKRASNIDRFDYDENRVSLGVSAVF